MNVLMLYRGCFSGGHWPNTQTPVSQTGSCRLPRASSVGQIPPSFLQTVRVSHIRWGLSVYDTEQSNAHYARKKALPSWRARTISLSMTVGMRWATVTTVQFENSRLKIRCRIASVLLSMLAVASSNTNTRLRFNNARPKQNSWRCPTLQFSPSSNTAKENLFSMSECCEVKVPRLTHVLQLLIIEHPLTTPKKQTEIYLVITCRI